VTILTVNSYEPERGREATLWLSAALMVCALHVGLAAAYLLLKPEPEAQAEAPAFEVAFVPATTTPAPAVPETQQALDQPPAPDQPSIDPPAGTPPPPQEPPPAQEETTVQPAPEPPPPAQVEARVQPEPAPPPVALSIPEPPAETKVPEQVAVLPPPDAKPVEIAPPPEKALTPPPEHTTRRPIPEENVQKESRKAAPPKPAAAPSSRPARVAMAPNPGAESEGAQQGRSSWQSELVAHIRRFATYNSQSNESGSVSISVTIDRNGRLKSRHLVSGSGSATLDRIAMDLLERAQPFPPFPPSMTEAQVVRTVPLHLRPR
jgi:periplasmic protein TonB